MLWPSLVTRLHLFSRNVGHVTFTDLKPIMFSSLVKNLRGFLRVCARYKRKQNSSPHKGKYPSFFVIPAGRTRGRYRVTMVSRPAKKSQIHEQRQDHELLPRNRKPVCCGSGWREAMWLLGMWIQL